jgi:hypothetical protein
MQMSWCEPAALILSAVLVMANFGSDASGGSHGDAADGRARHIAARSPLPHDSVKNREQRIGAPLPDALSAWAVRIDGTNVQRRVGAEALHLDLAVHVTIDPDSFEMLDLWIELEDSYIEIEPDSQYELGPELSQCCVSVMT